jgi:hypothetical protein
MITAEIKINGKLIAHVYAVNKGGDPDGTCAYLYEVYEVGMGVEGVKRGEVTHDRLDGGLQLIGTICDDLLMQDAKEGMEEENQD